MDTTTSQTQDLIRLDRLEPAEAERSLERLVILFLTADFSSTVKPFHQDHAHAEMQLTAFSLERLVPLKVGPLGSMKEMALLFLFSKTMPFGSLSWTNGLAAWGCPQFALQPGGRFSAEITSPRDTAGLWGPSFLSCQKWQMFFYMIYLYLCIYNHIYILICLYVIKLYIYIFGCLIYLYVISELIRYITTSHGLIQYIQYHQITFTENQTRRTHNHTHTV